MKTVEVDGMEFILRENGTAAVCRYLRKEQSVAIPETVQGYRVTELGDHAFYDAALKEIQIPAGVSRIADVVFLVRREVDADAMDSAREYFDNRYGHNARLPRYRHYDREEFESAEMATHMVFYKDVCDVTAIVDAGSYAEQYCKERDIKSISIDHITLDGQ